ncbi:MAG: M20 family metallopeptidase [Candidatus Binatia bacterium]
MTKTDSTWSDEVRSRKDSLIALRRDFHCYPELSFQEHRTAEIIATRLHGAGLEVRTGVSQTGVVVVLHGDRPGRTIAWRADIDALPVTEAVDVPFASRTPGVMHACGHDGHTAIALTLAEILAARRAQVCGTAVFIFQPAEEVGRGARPMIEAGVLDNPRVDEVYGMHLTTRLPVGQVVVRSGALMASTDGFEVEIQGKGGHGAFPYQAIDPITVAANILLGMQNLVSKEIKAQEPAVLTVGQITAGTQDNIIPTTAMMRGTLRTFNPGVRTQVMERLGNFASHLARAYRAEAALSFRGMEIPAVVNHPRVTAFVRQCAVDVLGSRALVDGELVMGGDDMSRFLQERPGCYFLVGVAPSSRPPKPHHAPEFEMNEEGLHVGLQVALQVVLGALQG